MVFKMLFSHLRRHFMIYFTGSVILLVVLQVVDEYFDGAFSWIIRPLTLLIIVMVIWFFLRAFRNAISTLVEPIEKRELRRLLSNYSIAVIGIIVIFAMLYSWADAVGIGHLNYGSCVPGVSAPTVSTYMDRFFFSGQTFFTVGYGNVCPAGLAKIINLLNAWAGHFFTAVIVAVGLSELLQGRNKPA